MINDEVEIIIANVDAWLQRCVIGLGLCPFAVKPNTNGSIRIAVSKATSEQGLLEELQSEIEGLQEAPETKVETSLLVVRGLLADFGDYNDFIAVVEQWLDDQAYSDDFQVASFHPDYQFAGTNKNDAENLTNKAPYPILHVLREVSIDRAVAGMADTDEIYKNNITKMLGLSEAEKQRLFPYLYR